MAVNCCVTPREIDGSDGVTAIEVSVAGVTVRVVKPLIAPAVAVIVVTPVATLVAKPPLAIVAMVGVEEVHVAEPVRFCVLPSE